MKRGFVLLIFVVITLMFFYVGSYFFGEKLIEDISRKYVVMYIFAAYYLGQYSMKFPKWSDS